MTELMPTEPITNQQRDRALRACAVFERFSSAFNRSKVKVNLVNNPQVPADAWSTAEDIYIADTALNDLVTIDGVLGVKGLVLHENLHIKYTPRKGSRLVDTVIDRGHFRTFNLLEDQRIETLAVGRYGRAVSRWLVPTVLNHVMKGGDISHGFPLLHGRRYLPLELRKAVRQAYKEQDKVARLAELIDQYRAFTFGGTANIDEALEVIAEVHDLLGSAPERERGGCHGNPIPSSPNRPEPKSEQDKAQSRDKGDEDDLEDDEPTADSSETGEDETDDITDTTAGHAPSDQPAGQPSNQPSDGQSDGQDGAPATNPTHGGGVSNDTTARTAEEIIKDIIEKSLDTVAEELRNDGRAINGVEFDLDGGVAVELRKRNTIEQTVSPATVLAGNAFGRELEELKVAHEPNWERRVKSGKLNLGRIIKGCDADEAFDKFKAGREDAVDIEAVILLDTSGSMDGLERVASESMWAIKRGLDTVKASTTVVTFDSICERLYDADESAGFTMRFAESRGSTNPLAGLRYARNILAESNRKVKVLFTITDGHWGSESAPSEEVVTALREGGVLTALVTLGHSSYGDHNHELTAVVAQPSSLLGLARELVQVATDINLSRQ